MRDVPDMTGPDGAGCEANDDGCSTFFYTNQQSARLMFYHDHSWGITRLNVYAGEAAGYTITDEAEQKLIADGTVPTDQIPLIVQDRTFVPGPEQLAAQDPTWDTDRWGGEGNFWYHHVYMPAQNPGDPSGMSAYGRWMYGPWFWPPATGTKYGPIANPYYDPACNLDEPGTWTYETAPYCEPEQIPGTPNISAGMEQFNDTPTVNGVAYPTTTVDPKSYRLRILNAANDRFFNFQWYIADPDPKNGDGQSEVKLKKAELEAAQLDPVVFPTPDRDGGALDGPDWIQIGSEGGFLPKPVVVDGQQETTYITDGTRFDVGNVDKHSLLLAPAERADAIVDFSKFAGQTLILYNDAPAAFPARISTYDYYTGAPDLSPVGAPPTLPGYGPNTRTVMRVKVCQRSEGRDVQHDQAEQRVQAQCGWHRVCSSPRSPRPSWDSSPTTPPTAPASPRPATATAGSTSTRCDGYVRVNDTAGFSFNTLAAPNSKKTIKLEPKAIHDEMNSTTFDEFGRMQANLGIEASPPTPGAQNVTLYPFVNPPTEMIDTTKLPKIDVTYANGEAASNVKIRPVGLADDGSQTVAGDAQRRGHASDPLPPLRRAGAQPGHVGQHHHPAGPGGVGLEGHRADGPASGHDRGAAPDHPRAAVRDPELRAAAQPDDGTWVDRDVQQHLPAGRPDHSHSEQAGQLRVGVRLPLPHPQSHEEMDMMRPVSVATPPRKPDGVLLSTQGGGARVTWNDNSIAETAHVIQRKQRGGEGWDTIGTIPSPLDAANDRGVRTFDDGEGLNTDSYRVVAENTVGYGAEFPQMTVNSTSDPAVFALTKPTNVAGTVTGANEITVTWDPSVADGVPPVTVVRGREVAVDRDTVVDGCRLGGGSEHESGRGRAGEGQFVDLPGACGERATVRVRGRIRRLRSRSPGTVPGAPTGVAGTSGPGVGEVSLSWTAPVDDGGTPIVNYVVQQAPVGDPTAWVDAAPATTADAGTTLVVSGLADSSEWVFQVAAVNADGTGAWSDPSTVGDDAAGCPVGCWVVWWLRVPRRRRWGGSRRRTLVVRR